MDLKMCDVSRMLNVSESTIRRWLAEGKIPAYRLGGQYRFSPMEIEAWVLKRRVGDAPSKDAKEALGQALSDDEDFNDEPMVVAGSNQFSLYRALHKGCIYSEVTGTTKEEVIKESMKKLASHLSLDPEMMAELLLDREKMMPTALNHGIAVPHTRDVLLQQRHDAVSCVFLEHPIPYGALDGKPVHTLFFLFASGDTQHLHLLAKIAHLSSMNNAISFFRKRPNKQEMLTFVKEWETNLTTSL